jgi:hypothetical protein
LRTAPPPARAVGKAAEAPIAVQPNEPQKAPAGNKPAKAAKPTKKALKVHPRMVRDSFTMPEADFALIAQLKARTLAGQRETKKSELLRAGLQALAALDKESLLRALGQLEHVKVGRPKKGHGHD